MSGTRIDSYGWTGRHPCANDFRLVLTLPHSWRMWIRKHAPWVFLPLFDVGSGHLLSWDGRGWWLYFGWKAWAKEGEISALYWETIPYRSMSAESLVNRGL